MPTKLLIFLRIKLKKFQQLFFKDLRVILFSKKNLASTIDQITSFSYGYGKRIKIHHESMIDYNELTIFNFNDNCLSFFLGSPYTLFKTSSRIIVTDKLLGYYCSAYYNN
jgi:hypothetical protein